jgi:nucleoid-associated protein YgaU
MRHPVKVPAALAVLSVGVGAACLFLKVPPEAQPLGVGLTPLVQVGESNRRPLMELQAGLHSSLAPLDKAFAAGVPAVDDTPQRQTQKSPFETTLPPAWPQLAREYPRTRETANQGADVTPPLARPTMHTVVDGDTLAKLAQRYLGSVDRQGELFEANRQLLADPELLPIGAVLRIPSLVPPP